MITKRAGLPISIGISGANLHDSRALEPLVRGIPPIRSRRGPRRRQSAKLHGDRGYDYDHLRRWLRQRGIWRRISRKRIEPPGGWGGIVGPSHARWPGSQDARRLHRRCERKAVHFLVFTSIACTLILLPQTRHMR